MEPRKLSPQKQYLLGEYAKFEQEHERSNQAYKLVREINTFIDESKDQGFTDMGQLNKMVAHQIANQSILYEDKSILDILGHVRTAGGANYGQTIYAQDLIRKVSNQIDTQKEKSERWRWQQEDRRLLERDRGLAIELGEWYNNKNKPPEGWNEEESWKILREKLYSAGKLDAVRGVEDRAWTLDQREDQSSLITVEEIQGNEELRKELFELAKDPQQLYTYLLTKRNTEPKALEYLLNVNDPIQPIGNHKLYSKATQGVKNFINGFAKRKVASLFPEWMERGGDPFAKVPASFLSAQTRYILEYEALVEDAYNRIARMEGGRRDFRYWSDNQKQAFQDAISIHDYKNEKRTDPISQLMRQADSELEGIMDDHLKPKSGVVDTDGAILSGKIGDVYTRITGKTPSGKVYATELLGILEDAESNFWLGEDFSDGFLENYWEDQGIDIDDDLTEGQRKRVQAWFIAVYKEIEDLIQKEAE